MKFLLFLTFFFASSISAYESSVAHTFCLQTNSLMQGITLESALHETSLSGIDIVLDLTTSTSADIEAFRERILGIIETYVNVLVTGPQQAYALTHLSPDKAVSFLKNICPTVIFKEDHCE
jgi:hypothetical protein